jgi:hypothetical protein
LARNRSSSNTAYIAPISYGCHAFIHWRRTADLYVTWLSA